MFFSFHYRETVEIGRTDFTKTEIDQIIMLLGRDFRGIDYHLINKNCNVFASKFSKVSNEIEEGSSFGELALLIKNGTRKATVKTSEPCLLLTLDYENFQ